jgi:hypothetical protein
LDGCLSASILYMYGRVVQVEMCNIEMRETLISGVSRVRIEGHKLVVPVIQHSQAVFDKCVR